MAFALVASACSSATPPYADPEGGEGITAEVELPDAELPEVALDVTAGPFQLTFESLPYGPSEDIEIEVADLGGGRLASGEIAGGVGSRSALVRDLPPGEVRTFVVDGGQRVAEGPAVTVPGDAPPDAALYQATELAPGFGYIPARDGTSLSVYVTLPGPVDGGPYPTLVEYSGYAPSQPGATDPGRLIVPALGYALVQVNVRGTGCSGGSFDAFEPIQRLDGYDVIETVATQDWAGQVGMYGISYAGIMQLHVAATRPPSLAAIAPLSVLDQLGSVLHPGGIHNDGFAESWTRRVTDQAAAYGQGWERALVDGGDTECARNQELRVHNPDLLARLRAQPVAELAAARSPDVLAPLIDVPVFIAGAWQDEQTGGRWPALLDDLEQVPVLRATMYNGLHADSISPELLASLIEFYDIYLEDPEPGASLFTTLAISAGLGRFYGQVLPVELRQFDAADRIAVRQEYEQRDPIRILFEQGAGEANLPVPSWEASFTTWPPAEVEPTALDFAGGDAGLVLSRDAPGSGRTATFTTAPEEGRVTIVDDLAAIWTAAPGWDWPPAAPARSIVAATEPLAGDLVMVGPASADLWLSADAPDADVEVTLSELAPDGTETYIQNGWLRLSRRALAPESTELRPVPSSLDGDVSPLVPGAEPVLARVEILPFAHVVRAGSRLRITIDTPGASRPSWQFDVLAEPVAVTLHTGPDHPSRLVVPALPNLEVPTERPACGWLRGQPCR